MGTYLEDLTAALNEWGKKNKLFAAKAEAKYARLKLKYEQEQNALQSKQHEITEKKTYKKPAS